ncbi:sn-glycerol-3-phosphate ABC transporter ATP-binding protein UgpC [Neorhizobium lilium]|uniref:sn-glycerol-3-phosphate ABC transporter ATP-binding protein UgpC n=1 Tax=Neorhizobium lilium TaxID=2503024 RepID=A0A444LL96_9HYPH|nr:sn-glycerol-3-phosphate ABC transporter ATP-binding protein UgpC [Neorhizobium lilium]RWX81030.1 sn-glycerol-3-phosphate ABC transporter ATP-binding protein UgpC [Neorhizobium lilium]
MANLTISGLKKNYGIVDVIHGLDLSVQDGEFVSLIGESGCGKSTLLRMIAGLEDISGGTISLNGRVINDVEPKNRDMAMVFQNYALYPHLTVAENMGFSLKLRNVEKAQIKTAVGEVAEMLNLTPYLDRLPRALSGGQRQRVAMGRAIVRRPQVFLFDEPLSNLDAKLRVQMRVEIRALQRRLGTTSIYVTHDQMEAMTMSDRIVILNKGRIEQVGSPLELYDRPANLFVATFIGSPAMNLFEGVVQRHNNGCFVRVADALLPLPSSIEISDHSEVVVGIRPEHFEVANPENGQALSFDLVLVEPTGAETHLYGKVGTQNVTVAVRDRLAQTAPAQIRLVARQNDIHVFRKSDGGRIG